MAALAPDPVTLAFDLRPYLAHIGYTGPLTRTYKTLYDITLAHSLKIPFENLEGHRGVSPKLDLRSLEDKFFKRHRGGYCCEQNTILYRALREIGFEITPLTARPWWGRSRDERMASIKTHMVLLVDIGEAAAKEAGVPGRYFTVDAGFGASTPSVPLILPIKGQEDYLGQVQDTPHGKFRFVSPPPYSAEAINGEGFDLEMSTPGGWFVVYRFCTTRVEFSDYLVGNWFTSTYPGHKFVLDVVVTRVLPPKGEGQPNRIALFNNRLVTRDPAGNPVATRFLSSQAEMEDTLRGDFGINLDGIDTRAMWEKVAARVKTLEEAKKAAEAAKPEA